ncbi:MAG: hypothetical protein H7239_05885 [Flavobacterium sp.]|nr:hypothetical protein [Flavobacterium sp.]
MKKSILKKLVLTTCFLAILFTSCEKEPLQEEQHANYESNIKKTKVNFANFKENNKAFDVFKNLNLIDTKPIIKNSNVQNATSYDFEIDFNDGTHFSYHNLESYTFPIKRVIDNGLLENIVISEHTDGKYYAKLLKYNLTSQEKIDLANDELKSIQNPIVTEVLGEYSFGNQIQSDCGFATITIITACVNGHTSASQCQLTGAAAPRIRSITVAIDCNGGELGGGGGTGDGSGGYYGNPFFPGGGGGGYITPNFPNETTPTEYYENGISEPVLSTADAQLFSQFLNDLRTVDLAGYNYLIANPEIKNQIFGYLATNSFNDESKAFSKEILVFFKERNWKAEVKQAISTGITSSAELTHTMYTKLSALATAYPSSISFINIIIDGIRNAASTVINTNASTCNWTDLFNMWLFELGPNPISFNGPSVTVNSLRTQQGVSQARNIALNRIANGNLSAIPPHSWIYGQQAFYDGMANGNIATSFLGSYSTAVSIFLLPNGQHMLIFTVENPSIWDSATRLRIDNDHNGVHDGIFPNHVRDTPSNPSSNPVLHIGGDFEQKWTWTETY